MAIQTAQSYFPRPDPSAESGPSDWLVGGGEMGKVLREKDWSQTPLGPLSEWPQSLRTTVSLCLASNFPISLAWGPKHIQIYNDGYWPICGAKHPASMGQDFSECWASAWPVIGDAFERALTGATSYLENQRMFLDRNGYLEETFFTFSFSPIRDESGGVGGLFHPVTETTAKMLSERRTRALRELAARTTNVQSSREVLERAAETLDGIELDIPFALLYLIDEQTSEAQLIAQRGIVGGTELTPELVALKTPEEPTVWSIAAVVAENRARELEQLRGRFGDHSSGPYEEPPDRALVMPLTLPGREHPSAVLILGASARLPFNDSYRAFFELLSACITTALANACAYEEERKRAEALAEIDRAKTAFFSNISHEFRTPLTLMLAPLEDELREVEGLPLARRQRLAVAQRNALRLLKLVNTLLDFARIESGRCSACFEPTDLAKFTADLASVFRSAVERGGLQLTVACPELPEPIYVDREMWEKIVLNLLSNAFKHTFHGAIEVGLELLGDRVQLSVRDTGVGIAEADLPHIFERFQRVRGAESRSHEGTGIGLALVKELVEAHGGKVTVESVPGRGSTFVVSLPRGRAHLLSERVRAQRGLEVASSRASAYVEEAMHWLPERANTPDSQPPVPAHPVPGQKRSRILWADDNADMRDYVHRLLAERYDVTAVPDGRAALTAALAEPPDLVLSDVMMPGLDGFGLLKELRDEPRTRTVPVILLSARAGEEAALSGLDAGADDYLVKPFSARELMSRVRTHLDLAQVRRQCSAELAQANRELEAFSYSVSHDLRAPLRAIDGFSAALLEDCGEQLDTQGRAYLDRVRAAAARMSLLIDDMLDLARMSRAPVRRELVNLSTLATSILEELARREPQRVVHWTVQPLLMATGDLRLLQVVLENLLGNAWKFTGRRHAAHIEVGASSHDGESLFYVRDDGAGFDPAYAAKLFQPFQRLHGQEEFDGTGIGLATVSRVVSRHGGRVWAEAAVGQGATFYFTLGGSR